MKGYVSRRLVWHMFIDWFHLWYASSWFHVCLLMCNLLLYKDTVNILGARRVAWGSCDPQLWFPLAHCSADFHEIWRPRWTKFLVGFANAAPTMQWSDEAGDDVEVRVDFHVVDESVPVRLGDCAKECEHLPVPLPEHSISSYWEWWSKKGKGV